jgi:molybdenum cofactor synthesis domain-containing protein
MIEVAILTISDAGFAGSRKDESGPALEKRCQERGWPIAARALVPDDPALISRQLIDWADRVVATLILTTGGTGIGARDHTPEATRAVLERELPGVSELIRRKGLEQTPFSVLSRGCAGARKRSFIVNLPGSPAGAVASLACIETLVPHAVRLLAGDTEH